MSDAALHLDAARAARWAARAIRPGPSGTRAELAEFVAGLHEAARFSHPVAVRASSLGPRLRATGQVPGRTLATVGRPEVLVVDRAGWAKAAGASFAAMLGEPAGGPGGGATAELAAALTLMAPRVLGQYDPYADRLLLIAPNLLAMRRALGGAVGRTDLERWVAVHELTHALQFRAAPWLAGHLTAQARALVDAGTEAGASVRGLVRAAREGRFRQDDFSLIDAVLDDEARDRVERLTAIMAVLEGHADVTMDRVGRAVGATKALRARLERRRRASSPAEAFVRRLLGLDAKLAQYHDGARFVRAVRRDAGWLALDPAFASLDAMPTPAEIADPSAWVRRVHPEPETEAGTEPGPPSTAAAGPDEP